MLLITNTVLHSVREYFVEERRKELLSQANVIAGQLTSSEYMMREKNRAELDEMIMDIGLRSNLRVLVLDSSCVVLYDTGFQSTGKTVLIPEVLEALEGKDLAREQENSMIYAAVSVVGDNTKEGAVLISGSLEDIDNTVSDIAKKGNYLLGIISFIVLLIIVVVSNVFTAPLKEMIRGIQRMSEGHFEKRLQVKSRVHNEMVDLALACNQMADQLEKVESTRQQFVSNVSHELKTPLSSIKVLSESILLQEDVPKEMYTEFLYDINSEVDRMTYIINDLLALVKLDQKEIPMNLTETDLNGILEEIIKRLQPLAMQKDIKIVYEKEKDIIVAADAVKFSLAISNLVDNAIKYTPVSGKVTVTLEGDHQNAFISVSDTGVGIPEDEVTRIFERFYRVDKTRDRETGGTGLGLSITHATVMMHHGSIKVSSKENEGTIIMVRIPLRQSTAIRE